MRLSLDDVLHHHGGLVGIEVANPDGQQLVVVFWFGKMLGQLHPHVVARETVHGLATRRLLQQHLLFGAGVVRIERPRLLV